MSISQDHGRCSQENVVMVSKHTPGGPRALLPCTPTAQGVNNVITEVAVLS